MSHSLFCALYHALLGRVFSRQSMNVPAQVTTAPAAAAPAAPAATALESPPEGWGLPPTIDEALRGSLGCPKTTTTQRIPENFTANDKDQLILVLKKTFELLYSCAKHAGLALGIDNVPTEHCEEVA